MEWKRRLKRVLSFLSITYEPQANSVVITLRLNTPFVLGAAFAAILLTLAFKYGSISFGSALELLTDLWRSSSWLLVGVAAVLVVLAVAAQKRDALGPIPAESGVWSRLAGQLPKGLRGTALLCLVLLAILFLVMWAASGSTAVTSDPIVPGARAEPRPTISGEETPRVWRELQKGNR